MVTKEGLARDLRKGHVMHRSFSHLAAETHHRIIDVSGDGGRIIHWLALCWPGNCTPTPPTSTAGLRIAEAKEIINTAMGGFPARRGLSPGRLTEDGAAN